MEHTFSSLNKLSSFQFGQSYTLKWQTQPYNLKFYIILEIIYLKDDSEFSWDHVCSTTTYIRCWL